MLSGITADQENQFFDINVMDLHGNESNLSRLLPLYLTHMQPMQVLSGHDEKEFFCREELSPTDTLEAPVPGDGTKDEAEDDMERAPEKKAHDPAQIYLREIRSISMTQHQAELRARRDLEASEECIKNLVLCTPHAVREIISLGCKLENGTVSIDDITADISEEAADGASDVCKNRVIALIRRIKHVEQKKRMMCKRLDCGQLNELEKTKMRGAIESCITRQVTLLQQINPGRKVITGIVLKLKQYYQSAQNDKGGAGEGAVTCIEDALMIKHPALERTIAAIEEEEGKIRQARDMLVTAHLGLVVYLAKRYKNSGLDFTDLIQEGNIGLMKAASRFDTSKRYHFKSEAIWYIKNAIIRAIVNQGKTIRIPDYLCIIMNKLARVSNRLLRETGREPTAEELGTILGISPHKFYHLYEMQKFVSLDQPCKEDDRNRLEDYIEDTTCACPGDVIDMRKLHASVKKMMERLTLQERRVVSMRYGIGYESDLTLEKVGQSLSLTRQRIKQIEDRALSKLVKYSKRNRLEAFLEA